MKKLLFTAMLILIGATANATNKRFELICDEDKWFSKEQYIIDNDGAYAYDIYITEVSTKETWEFRRDREHITLSSTGYSGSRLYDVDVTTGIYYIIEFTLDRLTNSYEITWYTEHDEGKWIEERSSSGTCSVLKTDF